MFRNCMWYISMFMVAILLIAPVHTNTPNSASEIQANQYVASDMSFEYVTNPSTDIILGVYYINSYYYLFAEDGIWRSSDLDVWTTTTGMQNPIGAGSTIIFTNGFYLCTSNDRIYKSSDGLAFSQVYDGASEQYSTIIYFSGYYYAFGYRYGGADIVRSSNGDTWAPVSISGYSLHNGFLGPSAIVFDSMLYACEYQGHIIRSSDGVSWTEILTDSSGTLHIYEYDDLLYVWGRGGFLFWSDSDGNNWQTKSIVANDSILLTSDTIFNDSIYIAAKVEPNYYAELYGLDTATKELVPIGSFASQLWGGWVGLAHDATGLIMAVEDGLMHLTVPAIVSQTTTDTTTTGTTTTTTTTTSTSTGVSPDILASLFFPVAGLAILVVVSLILISRRRGGEKPGYPPIKPPPREPPAHTSVKDTAENRELVLGALKSYPRVSVSELSELLGLSTDQVRRITLRLIATGSVIGAFDRTMDEFVSVSATNVGRELKTDTLKELPNCPHCGAPFTRQIGTGETVHCSSCGKTFSG